jgi:secreted trypsin-like serine protease
VSFLIALWLSIANAGAQDASQLVFVVGGHPAAEGAWPDVAAVTYRGIAMCTGTLIAPDLVLTAGHCVDTPVDGVKLDAPNWVTLGTKFDVVQRIAYPNWEQTYDVAILVLAEEAEIPPRTIASGCIVEDDLYDGAPVAVAGYGATEPDGGGFTAVLHEGFTEITDHDCTQLQLGCNPLVSPGGELIAGGDGVDTCFGDSGGPLYLLTARGDYLAGVTSRTFYDPGDEPCSLGGIYVRPDPLVEWIEDETGRTLPEVVCGYPPDPVAPPIVIEKGRRGVPRTCILSRCRCLRSTAAHPSSAVGASSTERTAGSPVTTRSWCG